MHKIYACAHKTCVWLGVAYDDSELAMEKILAILSWFPLQSTASFFGTVADNGEAYESALQKITQVLAKDGLAYNAMCKLFVRPWFERMWVVQEVVLSKNPWVMCGKLAIGWSEWVRFCIIFGDMYSRSLGKALDRVANLKLQDIALKNSRKCKELEIHRAQGASRDVVSLFAGFSRRLTKQPIDRLFALRGLMLEEQRSWLSVDYESPAPKIQIEFWSKALLATYIDPWMILRLASETSQATILPSWCPDITRGIEDEGLPTNNVTFTEPFARNSALISIGNDPPNSISLAGIELGIVLLVKAQPTHTSTYTYVPWERSCYDCFRLTQVDSEASDTGFYTYMRTLLKQQLYSPNDASIFSLPDQHTPEILSVYRQYQRLREELSQNFHAEMQDVRDAMRNDHFYFNLILDAGKSSFFTTRDGRIGMGPPGMQENDLVFTLDSYPWLWILRKLEDSVAYQLIGTAYIDGHMFHGLEPL